MTTARVALALHGLLGAALLMSACSPALNWRDWRAEKAGLVQLFPCKPVRQQRKLELVGRQLLMVLSVCDAEGVTWAQAFADVQDPAMVGPAIDALVGAAHANLGAPRSEASAHVVAGATPSPVAGRYLARGRAPDGRSVEQAVLVFAKGSVVVQVTALSSRLPADAVETFFGSVRADS